jgi:aryl-alcohol dehydrogenase-like predicted oxidoreductase
MDIALGCVNLGSASRSGSIRSQVRLIHEAIDLGVTLFDTADAYGSGASERVLGRALAGRRDRVRIATKAGYRFREVSALDRRARRSARPLRGLVSRVRPAAAAAAAGGSAYAAQDFSPGALRTALEGSLRRLRTEHVDVFQLHGPHELHDGLIEELADLVAVGKVGRIGIGAETLADARCWLEEPGVQTMQVGFGVLDPGARDLLASCRQRGIEAWARGVFGAGLLADGRGPLPDHPKAPFIAALRAIARDAGLEVGDLALGYVRAADVADAVVIGMSSVGHLRANVSRLGSPPLDSSVLAAIEGVVEQHRALLAVG